MLRSIITVRKRRSNWQAVGSNQSEIVLIFYMKPSIHLKCSRSGQHWLTYVFVKSKNYWEIRAQQSRNSQDIIWIFFAVHQWLCLRQNWPQWPVEWHFAIYFRILWIASITVQIIVSHGGRMKSWKFCCRHPGPLAHLTYSNHFTFVLCQNDLLVCMRTTFNTVGEWEKNFVRTVETSCLVS